MNITDVPAQTGFAEGEIFTETGRIGLITMVIELDVAGLFEEQLLVEVRIQKILSPFDGEYANDAEFDPEFTPFTFH